MGAPLARLVSLGAFDLSVPAFNHDDRADWPIDRDVNDIGAPGANRPCRFTPPSGSRIALLTVCAWCRRVLVDGDTSRGVSHGLCDDCLAQIDREGGARP